MQYKKIIFKSYIKLGQTLYWILYILLNIVSLIVYQITITLLIKILFIILNEILFLIFIGEHQFLYNKIITTIEPDWMKEIKGKRIYQITNFFDNVTQYKAGLKNLTLPEFVFARVHNLLTYSTDYEILQVEAWQNSTPTKEITDKYMQIILQSFTLSHNDIVLQAVNNFIYKINFIRPLETLIAWPGIFNKVLNFDPNVFYIYLYLKNLGWTETYMGIKLWHSWENFQQSIWTFQKKIQIQANWDQEISAYQKNFRIGKNISYETWEKMCNSLISPIWDLEYKINKLWIKGENWVCAPDWSLKEIVKIANIERNRVEIENNLIPSDKWTKKNLIVICAPCKLTINLNETIPINDNNDNNYKFNFPDCRDKLSPESYKQIEEIKKLLNKDVIIIFLDQKEVLLNWIGGKMKLYQFMTNSNTYIPLPLTKIEILKQLIKIVGKQLETSLILFGHCRPLLETTDPTLKRSLTQLVYLISKNWASIMLKWPDDLDVQLTFLTTDSGIFINSKWITHSFYVQTIAPSYACLIGAPHEIIRPVCMKALTYADSSYISKNTIVNLWSNFPYPEFAKTVKKKLLFNNFRLVHIPNIQTNVPSNENNLTLIEKLDKSSTQFYENIDSLWKEELKKGKLAEINECTYDTTTNYGFKEEEFIQNETPVKNFQEKLTLLSRKIYNAILSLSFYCNLFLKFNIQLIKTFFKLIAILFLFLIITQLIIKFFKDIIIWIQQDKYKFSKEKYRYRDEISDTWHFYNPNAPWWHTNRWRFRDGTLWIDHVFFKIRFIYNKKPIYKDGIAWYPVKRRGEIVYTRDIKHFSSSLL